MGAYVSSVIDAKSRLSTYLIAYPCQLELIDVLRDQIRDCCPAVALERGQAYSIGGPSGRTDSGASSWRLCRAHDSTRLPPISPGVPSDHPACVYTRTRDRKHVVAVLLDVTENPPSYETERVARERSGVFHILYLSNTTSSIYIITYRCLKIKSTYSVIL